MRENGVPLLGNHAEVAIKSGRRNAPSRQAHAAAAQAYPMGKSSMTKPSVDHNHLESVELSELANSRAVGGLAEAGTDVCRNRMGMHAQPIGRQRRGIAQSAEHQWDVTKMAPVLTWLSAHATGKEREREREREPTSPSMRSEHQENRPARIPRAYCQDQENKHNKLTNRCTSNAMIGDAKRREFLSLTQAI
ncbi:hypothetical protein KP509_30G021600 [Ceratopteris richardii]|uniref:Uncharacterized protein n=1 Tax=Ceratopteris richardii TaxID=49495 RepID=A0A8T2R2L4_CERRI|nr:hypothetical protein KP509_30G021600 [Ceratopteris richardii]